MGDDPQGHLFWGRLSVVLDSASERYDADIVLVGRVQAMTSGSWSIGWEFWIDGELLSFAGQSSDIAQLGGDAVNFLADQLAQRFAVLGRLPQDIRVGVSGIRSATDYGNLLGYLGSLEFVDEVSLIRVQADRLGLIVTTRADPEQLLRMFKVDRYLSDVGPSMDNPSDVELMWQSR